MLRAVPASPTLLCTYNHWDGHCSARHITKLGSLIHNLIGGNQSEIHEQQFHHGPHPNHRCSNTETNKTGFADGSITHTLRTKLVDQILGHAEDAAMMANVFPHEEDAWVDSHLFTERFVQSLGIGYCWHKISSP